MPLSVLDQSPALAGVAPDESIRDTLALAAHCEALGYRRFWVSEHHNHPSILGTAPEILMAAIAATTKRIRVGAAGIMLPHYAAFKVAEQFRVLEALAPGRIDMGLGRAPGSDRLTAFALNPDADAAAERFPAQVRDLLAWVSGAPLAEGHPFAKVVAHPQGPSVPEPWILGSSDYGAQLAAHFGLPYCFAHFFTDGRGAEEAMALYHQNYRPSARFPKPHAALCVWALAADTAAEAERHYAPRALWRIRRDRNELGPLPTPDEALAYPYSDVERAAIARGRARAYVG
ncbi:MAG: LLM class flavin-dependent oxidoreductase, partial [Alphaproteobacteria bacterium]|nr:LLM class flavin-dependent oxidoreductase [Alphaproteobacteria bacterium]